MIYRQNKSTLHVSLGLLIAHLSACLFAVSPLPYFSVCVCFIL